MSQAIGVFDSGIGGLTVVREITGLLPEEQIIYFGDTARVPYGSKSRETISSFAFESVRFLLSRHVKMIVIACNTASAVALEALQQAFQIPILGVLEPGAAAAVATGARRVGVIGTEATIRSGAYERAIRGLDPNVEVVGRSCPLFVPLAEENWLDRPATRLIAEEYLDPLREAEIGALVLGCTHYPLLKPVISETIGEGVTLVDSAVETARAVQAALDSFKLRAAGGAPSPHRFYLSDIPPRFGEIGERFLGQPIDHLMKLSIEK
jgi:glutamate racemase